MKVSRLTVQQLNRALLARQLLLARVKLPVATVLERLVGMQAQTPLSPYTALWSRLDGFRPEQLARLMATRRAARIVLMRSTIHLVTARDALALRPVVQPAITRSATTFFRRLRDVDADVLAAHGREILAAEPLNWTSLGVKLSERFPGRDPEALAHSVRSLVPLVQPPPRGLWGQSGAAVHQAADDYLNVTTKPLALERLILRYLGAFGPATVMDAQAWSGLTKLRDVFESLRPKLAVFRGPHDEELFDLPRAPRPAHRAPPPRFLPDFDNILLAHADRTRIVSDEVRQRVWKHQGLVPTALVNGHVVALWRLERSTRSVTLAIEPLTGIARKDRAALAEEGRGMLAFLEPQRGHKVRYT